MIRLSILSISLILMSACISGGISSAGSLSDLPNKHFTPGAIATTDVSRICVVGYTRTVRPQGERWYQLKRQVYARYGLRRIPNSAELDHLIPLELGGSPDSLLNLWPEPFAGVWNATVKDDLENRMHRMVCDGILNVATAQEMIAIDWIKAYKQVFHTDHPLHRGKQ